MDPSEIFNKKLREPQQATFPLNTSIFGGKCRIENSSVPEFNVDVYLKATSNLTYELYTDVTIDSNGNITYNAAGFLGVSQCVYGHCNHNWVLWFPSNLELFCKDRFCQRGSGREVCADVERNSPVT